jgi:hypothetical protein
MADLKNRGIMCDLVISETRQAYGCREIRQVEILFKEEGSCLHFFPAACVCAVILFL